MKEWPLPADRPEGPQRHGIVLVGLGGGEADGSGGLPPVGLVTRQLAALLERPVLRLETQSSPDAAQAALAEQGLACGAGWLAGLEIDVGLPLADGRCWAEALGAWRQPALLVVASDQLQGGQPAAATALLRYWQVPLLGLLQWDGTWQAEARRRDGLPWLGHLSAPQPAPGAGAGVATPLLGCDADGDSGPALAAALSLRWQQLARA